MKLVRLAGVALDARSVGSTEDPLERAHAARWIAGNALAARGLRVAVDGSTPCGARLFELRVTSLTGLLAAIATVPALVDTATLPVRWRLALQALGMPVLDRPVPAVLSAGASVVVLAALEPSHTLTVDARATGCRVHVAPAERMLAA